MSFSEVVKKKGTASVSDDLQRTILAFDNHPESYTKATMGTLIYLVVFVLLIPYLLLKNKYYEVLTAYFPNVDMIATSLGYNGGPNFITDNDNIWLYLYNPSNFTAFGFLSTTILNYFALLGMTFIVAYTTYTEKSWIRGWSKAFFMAFFTYLAPNNFIVLLQEYLEVKIGYDVTKESSFQYLIIAGLGLIFSYFVILVEAFFISHFQDNVIHFIKFIKRLVK